MVPVAAVLARGRAWVVATASGLALAGAVLMLLFVGVGGRIPQYYTDPLREAVIVLWRGGTLVEWSDGPFARNLARLFAPGLVDRLPKGLQGLQFAPLVVCQAAGIAWIWWRTRPEVDTEKESSRRGDRGTLPPGHDRV
jgi:hypothetical protein